MCVPKSRRGFDNDNAPMTIVLSFSSLFVVSMEGIVPDMERGLVMADIVPRGEGREKEVVVKCREDGGSMTVLRLITVAICSVIHDDPISPGKHR